MSGQRERNQRKYQQMEDAADKIMGLSVEMIELWNILQIDTDEIMRAIHEQDTSLELGVYRKYLVSTILIFESAHSLQQFIHDVKKMI